MAEDAGKGCVKISVEIPVNEEISLISIFLLKNIQMKSILKRNNNYATSCSTTFG